MVAYPTEGYFFLTSTYSSSAVRCRSVSRKVINICVRCSVCFRFFLRIWDSNILRSFVYGTMDPEYEIEFQYQNATVSGSCQVFLKKIHIQFQINPYTADNEEDAIANLYTLRRKERWMSCRQAARRCVTSGPAAGNKQNEEKRSSQQSVTMSPRLRPPVEDQQPCDRKMS